MTFSTPGLVLLGKVTLQGVRKLGVKGSQHKFVCLWPDHISGGLMLHGSVDKSDQAYVGHIADVSVYQELEVGDVDQRQIAANIQFFQIFLNLLTLNWTSGKDSGECEAQKN